jgi:hypothetical protein
LAQVRSGSKADLTAPKSNFRYTPQSGLRADIAPCPFRAITGEVIHSITSSARASNVGGIQIEHDGRLDQASVLDFFPFFLR